MLKQIAHFAALSLSVLLCSVASAQTFPSAPITIAVPTPPGGPSDTMMRILAAKMSENMHQQVIIENKPGAGGIISTQSILRMPADGYSLAAVYLSHATNLYTSPSIPYDTLKDFAPVFLVATGPNVLIVSKDVPATNVAELIAYAKANPDKLNFGASAVGGSSHLGGELFKSMAGIQMQTVPYKGTGALIPDMISGRIQVTVDSYLQFLPHAKTGAIRMIGVTSAKRMDFDPSIPAIAETLPGYEVLGWWGLVANAATPPAIIAKLNQEATRALADSVVKQKISALGVVPAGGTPEEFSALIRTEVKKWGPIVKEAGLVEK